MRVPSLQGRMLCLFAYIWKKEFLHLDSGYDSSPKYSSSILTMDKKEKSYIYLRRHLLFSPHLLHSTVGPLGDCVFVCAAILWNQCRGQTAHLWCRSALFKEQKTLPGLSRLSSGVSAEVDRLCPALRTGGLLFGAPLDLPLVTGPGVQVETPQSALPAG